MVDVDHLRPLCSAASLLQSCNQQAFAGDTDVSVVASARQAFGLPLLALNLILFFGPLPHVNGWFFDWYSRLCDPEHTCSPGSNTAPEGRRCLTSCATLCIQPGCHTSGFVGCTSRDTRAYTADRSRTGDRWRVPARSLIMACSTAPLQLIAYRRSVWLAIGASVLWGITPVFEKTAILHTFPENPTAAAFGALLMLGIILFPIMLRSAHHPAAQIRARWARFCGARGHRRDRPTLWLRCFQPWSRWICLGLVQDELGLRLVVGIYFSSRKGCSAPITRCLGDRTGGNSDNDVKGPWITVFSELLLCHRGGPR